jgi:hypothetical protein
VKKFCRCSGIFTPQLLYGTDPEFCTGSADGDQSCLFSASTRPRERVRSQANQGLSLRIGCVGNIILPTERAVVLDREVNKAKSKSGPGTNSAYDVPVFCSTSVYSSEVISDLAQNTNPSATRKCAVKEH